MKRQRGSHILSGYLAHWNFFHRLLHWTCRRRPITVHEPECIHNHVCECFDLAPCHSIHNVIHEERIKYEVTDNAQTISITRREDKCGVVPSAQSIQFGPLFLRELRTTVFEPFRRLNIKILAAGVKLGRNAAVRDEVGQTDCNRFQWCRRNLKHGIFRKSSHFRIY